MTQRRIKAASFGGLESIELKGFYFLGKQKVAKTLARIRPPFPSLRENSYNFRGNLFFGFMDCFALATQGLAMTNEVRIKIP